MHHVDQISCASPFSFPMPVLALRSCARTLGTNSVLGAMRAVLVPTPGGPEALLLGEAPAPEAGPGEVVVRVAATALNRADCLQRQGSYPPPKGASPILGLECSGTILSVGSEVASWKVGDQVCALLAGGGYAEQVAVPAGQLLPVPRGLSLLEAAALPEVACTVWSSVFMASRLRRGEAFLVHGGSSGIGTFAIQLCKEQGARVFCTAGSEEKLERCRALGAEVAINYRTEDFVERAKAETDGEGLDVILDNMGALYLPQNLRALRADGRLFVLGMQGGRLGELDLGRMLVKRLSVASAGLRSRPQEQKNEIVRQVGQHVWPLVEAGRVKPIIHKVMPLADVAEAHSLMESSAHIGKIVLTV